MRNFIVAAAFASLALPAAPAIAQSATISVTASQERHDARLERKREREDARRDRKRDLRDARTERQRLQRVDRSNYGRYDFDRPDPAHGDYQADRYYYDSSKYHTRRLGPNDRVYRGQDNRYYCRRSDGTTGLIIGAVAGGLFGNAIAPGDSQTLGTLLGIGVGATIGASIDSNQRINCR